MEHLPLSDVVERNLAILFPRDKQAEVRAILREQCGANIPMWSSAGIDRLRCAVLKLSGGDLEKLRRAIRAAKRDFRDVLMWAGFGDTESYKNWTAERTS